MKFIIKNSKKDDIKILKGIEIPLRNRFSLYDLVIDDYEHDCLIESWDPMTLTGDVSGNLDPGTFILIKRNVPDKNIWGLLRVTKHGETSMDGILPIGEYNTDVSDEALELREILMTPLKDGEF